MAASYRRDDYADAEGFFAQLGLALEGYGDDVIERATDAKNPLSIQRTCKFAPNLAEATACCDAIFAEMQRSAELRKRYGAPLRDQSLPPRVLGAATRSALCERYGLRDIPLGWDAVDVARAAGRHGAGLQAAIDAGTAQCVRSDFRTAGQIGLPSFVDRPFAPPLDSEWPPSS